MKKKKTPHTHTHARVEVHHLNAFQTLLLLPASNTHFISVARVFYDGAKMLGTRFFQPEPSSPIILITHHTYTRCIINLQKKNKKHYSRFGALRKYASATAVENHLTNTPQSKSRKGA